MLPNTYPDMLWDFANLIKRFASLSFAPDFNTLPQSLYNRLMTTITGFSLTRFIRSSETKSGFIEELKKKKTKRLQSNEFETFGLCQTGTLFWTLFMSVVKKTLLCVRTTYSPSVCDVFENTHATDSFHSVVWTCARRRVVCDSIVSATRLMFLFWWKNKKNRAYNVALYHDLDK